MRCGLAVGLTSLLLALALALALAPPAALGADARCQTLAQGIKFCSGPDPEALTRPESQAAAPALYSLSARQAIQIADASGEKLRDELAEHPRYRRRAFTKGPRRWQVSYYAGGDEVAQVIVDERSGRAVEVWTGPQVEWRMARGLPGEFGRKINAPYIWIPLMVAFIVPFIDWRRPFRLLHLDLAMLLAFSLSHVFFNRAEIYTSVPLVYPVLGYLLLRMLVLAYLRPPGSERQPLRLLVPVSALAVALVVLIGFRIGLNVTNSNVIDVGYSGVIGADRISHGEELYGARNFPGDNPFGDTYGPVNYYAYVPFELALPWSGHWDDVLAAHAAAIFFDLATMLGLFLIGRRLRRGQAGTELGVVLAYAWAAFPYTAFALNTNSNDSLIAMLLVYTFLFLQSSRLRGGLIALAGLAKFAPLALVPLMLGYSRNARGALRFLVWFFVVALVVTLPVVLDVGIERLWDRTIGFQLGRDSPFSIWGQNPGLEPVQNLVKALGIALALFVAIVPRRKSPIQVAALGAAVLIALQISLTYWFYLYIVWFLPFVLIALLGREAAIDEHLDSGRGERDELDRAREPALA